MKQPSQLKRGFTFIEILAAIFVMAMMIAAFAAIMHTSFLTREAKQQELALRVAAHKLESLRASGYASLTSGGSFSDAFMAGLNSATGTLTISSYNATTKQVAVTVSWKRQQGGTSTVSLSTLITQTGGLK